MHKLSHTHFYLFSMCRTRSEVPMWWRVGPRQIPELCENMTNALAHLNWKPKHSVWIRPDWMLLHCSHPAKKPLRKLWYSTAGQI